MDKGSHPPTPLTHKGACDKSLEARSIFRFLVLCHEKLKTSPLLQEKEGARETGGGFDQINFHKTIKL